MTTPRYTEADVRRLVKTVSAFTESLDDSWNITKPALREALKPFQPDPEEELIEAMAKAYLETFSCSTWDGVGEVLREQYRRGMRATLAVVKSKGLPS